MAQVNVADTMALSAHGFYRGSDGAVRRAPGDDQEIAIRIAGGDDVGNVLRDCFNFCCAQANHMLVVERFVVDVTSHVLLFKAADPVFETGRAGNGPGPRKSFRIAAVRLEVNWVGGEL